MSTYRLPKEVGELIGTAMPADQIRKFWTTRHHELDDRSPQQVWRLGPAFRQRVRELILAAKIGDTA